MWGQGGVCVGHVGARWVSHVSQVVKPYGSGEVHKFRRASQGYHRGNIRGSSNEALAFWYDVYMGYESMLHWGEGGCPPPDPLPITPPLTAGCSLSYFIILCFILFLFIFYGSWRQPTA
jgi:hypothetical protein